MKIEITRDFTWGSTKYPKGYVGEFHAHVAEAIIKRQLGKISRPAKKPKPVEVEPEIGSEEGYERRDMAPTKRRRRMPEGS